MNSLKQFHCPGAPAKAPALRIKAIGAAIFLHSMACSAGAAETTYAFDLAGNLAAEVLSASSAPASITQQPRNQLGRISGRASLTVIATGSSPLAYQWRRDDVPITGATRSTLFLENLTEGDFGEYTVVVSNGVASVTSAEALLQLDADDDNLPDTWETGHFGSTVAQSSFGDADSDGVSNLDEYNDATIPTSAASLRFKLTVEGGGVTVLPFQSRYAPGAVVTLSAHDQGGLEFTGWSGDATDTSNPVQITMNGNKRVKVLRTPMPLDAAFQPLITRRGGAIVNDILKLSGGKVLIAGRFDAVNGAPRMNIARMNADGTVDPTFQGPVFSRAETDEVILSIALQGDGRILIAGGFDFINGAASSSIVRLLPDGAHDTTFNAPLIASINSIAVQPDDKVIVGGLFTTVAGSTRRNVLRLSAAGALDTGFDTSNGPDDEVFKVLWQGPGKILVGGEFLNINATSRRRVARLTDTGALDTSFDPGTAANDDVTALALDGSGRILVGGSFTTFNGSSAGGVLTRLNDTGARDTTFSVSRAGWDLEGPVTDVTVQGDGKIIAAGVFTFEDATEITRNRPVRFTDSGAWDESFSVLVSINGSLQALELQGDGSFWLGGGFQTLNSTNQFNLGRVSALGVVQESSQFPSATAAAFADVVAYPDGRLLIFGNFHVVGGVPRNGIARLQSDGSLDAQFNPGAISTITHAVKAAHILADGKILLGGEIYTSSLFSSYKPIIRVSSTGVLDGTFQAPAGVFDDVLSLDLQSDGKIVIGGEFNTTSPLMKFVARLGTNGALDNSFPAQANGVVWSVEVGTDDAVLLGGQFTTINGTQRRGTALLTSAGALDSSFSTGAEPTTFFGVRSARFLPDGVAIIGDFSYTGGSRAGYASLTPAGALHATRNQGGLLGGITFPFFATLSGRPGGGFWAAGSFATLDGATQTYLAPLLPSGRPDFVQVMDLQRPNAPVTSVVQLSSGDLLIGGRFHQVGGLDRFGLARYTSTSRIQIGTPSTQPVGPSFEPGGPLELSVAAQSLDNSLAAVEFEYSSDGETFARLAPAQMIAPGTWLASVNLGVGGVFYLRAAAYDTAGFRRTSLVQGPFKAGDPPVITSAATAAGLIQQPFIYTATASPTGGALTAFTAGNLPAWAAFAFQSTTNNALLSGTPDAIGQTLVTLTATNAAGSGQGQVAVQIFDTYDHWKQSRFSPAELGDPLLSGPDADFDRDGLTNFQEFALRAQVKTPDLTAVPTVSVNSHGANKYLTLTYRRYKWAGQTMFTPEVSGEMSSWNSGPTYTTEVSRTDNGDSTETVVVRDNVQSSSAIRRFMRLKVEAN